MALMGESGCGKSTLLKALYGLLTLEKGAVFYGEEKLLGPEYHLVPGHPFMKYLSQNFDLMPYISAAQNVGDFLSNFYPEEKKKRINELLAVVGMQDYAETHVRYLSGGQQQRIALARVLAKEPKILLLDEPFSQIDNFKKNELRYRLFEYLKAKQISCITATHDKEDVLAFADQIMVLKNGEKVIQNTPKQLFKNPTNHYAASLFSHANKLNTNIFNASAEKNILVYPHEIKIDPKSNTKAVVEKCYYKGTHFELKVTCTQTPLTLISTNAYKIGSEIGIGIPQTILEKREKAF